MIEMILLGLLLLLIQLMLPSVIALIGGNVSVAYLFSSRDETPEKTATVERAQRACANLLETLPAFLVLGVLAILQGADVVVLAQGWLILRVVYLAFYLTGTAYARSFVWVASVGCLIGMVLPLL